MSSSTLADGIELTERIAGDVAHFSPVAKAVFDFGKKRLSRDNIKKIIQLVWTELYTIGQTLLDEDNAAALKHIEVYVTCKLQFSQMTADLEGIEKEVDRLKIFQVMRKRSLYDRSVAAATEATKLKVDVWRKSTLARLELQDLEGTPVVTSLEVYDLGQPSEPAGPVMLIAHPMPPAANIDTRLSDDALHGSEHSDTDSIFGNPWLDLARPQDAPPAYNEEMSTASDSCSDVPTSRLDKGKGRAVEPELEDDVHQRDAA